MKHYFDDTTIVGQYIKTLVNEYRKRRRGITPAEFYEILHNVADMTIENH